MMDISSAEWLSDLAMEEDAAIKQHCEMMMMMSWEELNHHCLDPSDLKMDMKATSSSLNTSNLQAEKNNSGWSSCASSSRISAGKFISFGNSADEYTTDHDNKYSNINKKKDAVLDNDGHGGYNSNYTNKHNSQQNKARNNKKYGSSSSVGVCSQEHVVAERKRREKMTQRFHALSALVPGLTKMDKASILNDAAKYLKQLEEQVKMLEEQTANRTIESVALVKSSKMQQDPNLDGNSSSDDNSNSYSSNHQLLEIEARACNKNVLIRIHSQKDQHLIRKVLNEMEKLHLTTLNFNTIPFGGFAMDITIVSQMDDDFGLTMKDLVMQLRLALQQCT